MKPEFMDYHDPNMTIVKPLKMKDYNMSDPQIHRLPGLLYCITSKCM
jgi:hypothetical protein